MNATDTTSTSSDAATAGQLPAWLLGMTFVIQYNPNCPSPFLVRLPGFMSAGVDNKTYYGPEAQRTKDCLGFGKTAEAAALAAKAELDKGRLAWETMWAEKRRLEDEERARRTAEWRARQASEAAPSEAV